MKTRLISFLLSTGCVGTLFLSAAVIGPVGNFDKNALWGTPDINGIDANGLSTRGILFFDMTNDVGTVDRITEALESAALTHSLSAAEISQLQEILAIANVLSDVPQATDQVKQWLKENLSSPQRADMALLLADLLFEKGQISDANVAYYDIQLDALSPNLRADYLYHKALSDLKLASYTEARNGFSNPELLSSKEYGNAARFYLGYVDYIERDYEAAVKTWRQVQTTSLPGSMTDFYLAQIAYYNGDYDKALSLAQQSLNKQISDKAFIAEANRVIGESLYQTGQASEAIPYLKNYVSQIENPERSTQYILGLARYDDGDYAGAVESLTPVTKDESAMGQSAYMFIGQALLKQGDVNAAMMAFNRALTMNYDRNVTESAYYNYAVAKSRGANMPFASSVETFEEFLTRYPNSRFADDVAKYIVTGYVTDGNYQAALNSINKVQQPSSDILAAKQKVLYLLGAQLLGTDKPEQAVRILSEGKQLAQYDKETAQETQLLLGEAYYRTGQYNKAAEELINYIDETDSQNPNHAVALYDLAYTRMAQKDWGKAQTDFERLLDKPGALSKSTLADVQARLGDARYYQRNWSGAATAYDNAYKTDEKTGDYPLYQKALMLGYEGDNDGKIENLDLLISSFPSSALIPDALIEKAEAYTRKGQTDEADNIYRLVIEKYSETGQGRRAYMNLAADQVEKGDKEGAIETYHALIKQAPTSEDAQLASDAVKRLHAEQGTLNQYAQFISGIEGAPTFDADEAETLTWNAAEHNYLNGNGVGMVERYVNEYPQGRYKARAYHYMTEQARNEDNEEDMYRWASLLVKEYPDNILAEDAMITKATVDINNGRGFEAMETWKILEQKASTPETKNIARQGIMRAAVDINDAKKLRSAAEELLKSSILGAEDKTEASFNLALADRMEGNNASAVSAWKELAQNTDDIYGAKSAVYAAETLNELERYKEAAQVAEDFINSNTPHYYWLARGFIALSDAYMQLGREFEAREFLTAIKENYPGDEVDIIDMIDERLN